MNRAEQFRVAMLLFHGGLSLTAAGLLLRWLRRLHPSANLQSPVSSLPRTRWVTALLCDAGWLGIAMVLLAFAAALLTHAPPWAAMRLVCQGLFGEAVLFTAALAALHGARGLRRRAFALAVVPLLLLLAYWEAYHHGPANLQVRRHAVDLARGRPPAGTLRVLHLSDFQTDRIGDWERRVVRAARAQRPDLILFTGDVVQERLHPTYAQATADFTALLKQEQLSAPLGFFAVPGDTEGSDWQRLFAGLPVQRLQDSHGLIPLPGGRALAVTGLDVPTSRARSPEALAALLAAAPPADLHLVMGHSPDFAIPLATLAPARSPISDLQTPSATPAGHRVDLALAGHTHGGQVVIPFFGPPFTLSRLPRRYAGGLNDYRGIPLHVCRGTGRERTLAPQIRFLCPPEICLLEVTY